MNANQVAKQLTAAGISVIAVTEGQAHVDGGIQISETVCVTVPTFGRGYGVTQQIGNNFKFFPARKSLRALIADIQKAVA